MRHLPPSLKSAEVLVGLDSPDDAGVYRLTDDLAIVQTVDFFTPVVDDPYAFGQIAAANALSDVYAMGGRPITALNLVGFPVSKLDKAILAEILRGGGNKVEESGAVVVGGHSIDDQEPKFGLAVTGVVHPQRVLQKSGARPGDAILLTKPIGVGVLTTAIKKADVPARVVDETVRTMAKLNDVVDVLAGCDVHACTDVTGFGLLGHASEVARYSGVGLEIRAGAVPVLEAAWDYAEQGLFPGGSNANLRFLLNNGYVDFADGIREIERRMLADAVTSGGLLIALPERQAPALMEALTARGTLAAALIGRATGDHPGVIRVIP